MQLLCAPHDLHPSIKKDETIQAFGYNPAFLKQNSCKPIVVQCKICGNKRIKQYRLANQDSCLNCANRIKSQSNENRLRRSQRMKDFYRNGGRHPMSGRKQSAKAIEAIRATGRMLKGKKNPGYGKCRHGKGVWYNKSDGARVFLRSSYELAFAKYLDSYNATWLYEPQAFPINYTFKGIEKEGTYRPDFYLPSTDTWIEVKGWWRDDARAKFDAFCAQYPDIIILVYDEQKLKSIKCL